MSLYDDLGVETSDSKTEGWSKNFKLLQSQLQVKKAALTQAKSQRTKQSTVLAPVIDLKRGGSSDDRQIVDTPPHVAAGLKDPVPSGFSAGEVLIPLADEYDPMFPNDYEKVVKRQREERQRQRELERQKEIEEREKRRKDRHEASGFSRRPDPDSDEDEDYERERRKRKPLHYSRNSGDVAMLKVYRCASMTIKQCQPPISCPRVLRSGEMSPPHPPASRPLSLLRAALPLNTVSVMPVRAGPPSSQRQSPGGWDKDGGSRFSHLLPPHTSPGRLTQPLGVDSWSLSHLASVSACSECSAE